MLLSPCVPVVLVSSGNIYIYNIFYIIVTSFLLDYCMRSSCTCFVWQYNYIYNNYIYIIIIYIYNIFYIILTSFLLDYWMHSSCTCLVRRYIYIIYNIFYIILTSFLLDYWMHSSCTCLVRRYIYYINMSDIILTSFLLHYWMHSSCTCTCFDINFRDRFDNRTKMKHIRRNIRRQNINSVILSIMYR